MITPKHADPHRRSRSDLDLRPASLTSFRAVRTTSLVHSPNVEKRLSRVEGPSQAASTVHSQTQSRARLADSEVLHFLASLPARRRPFLNVVFALRCEQGDGGRGLRDEYTTLRAHIAAHGPVTAEGGGVAVLRLWTREIVRATLYLHH